LHSFFNGKNPAGFEYQVSYWEILSRLSSTGLIQQDFFFGFLLFADIPEDS